jgi:AcrR family transcriptional regulator
MTTREPVTRERLVRTAVALADRKGLEAASMRALAQELAVVPMALYKHVRGRDELLDGMIDVVFAELDPPSGPWRAAMRHRAEAMRAALRRHPWAIGRMESTGTPGLANLRHHDATLGCLRRAGFDFRRAVHVMSACDSYIYGFALQERTLPFATPEESAEVAAARSAAQPELAALFPSLVEVVGELAAAGYDADAEFGIGLDLLLDGIELRAADWASGDG